MIISFLFGLFLGFSNGENDNFKGVDTLLGSKTTSYKVALIWATLTTLAGSLTAFFLAQKLMLNFSSKGLVPDDISKLALLIFRNLKKNILKNILKEGVVFI